MTGKERITAIKSALLRADDGFALEMVEAIQRRASKDIDYAYTFYMWLMGERGTVVLRDELCGPFERFSFVRDASNKLPAPFQNMWEAIDSASAKTHEPT